MEQAELHRLFHKRWTQQISKDEASLLASLMQDKRIRESHDQLYQYWLISENYRPKNDFDSAIGLSRFKEKVMLEQSPLKSNVLGRTQSKPRLLLLKIFGGILLLMLVIFAGYRYFSHQVQELITDTTTIKHVELPDGSQFWLNINSIISYPKYNIGDRSIQLKGEAYFEMKSDASRPFSIHTPLAEVSGTEAAFNLSSSSMSKNFLLQSNKGFLNVLQSNKEDAEVAPNFQLKYTFSQDKWVHSELKSTNVGAWRDKVLRFEDVSLSQVFKDLENCFNISIDARKLNNIGCDFSSTKIRSMGDAIQALNSAFPKLNIEGPDQRKYIFSGTTCE